jgi:hypothetical protein
LSFSFDRSEAIRRLIESALARGLVVLLLGPLINIGS